ncbi:MAG TPA: hypothetical protein VNM48_03405 [Chloroflexota bacterium]|nr:hypothetical protein [Chloroflexota bacterium]
MPVQMRGGKAYSTVQERLTAAHGEAARPEGIASIVTTLQSLPSSSGPVVFAIATVTFTDGRTFTGISEAQFDATSGADKTNPVEVAETSSVGRALSMAGFYGSDDGLAGAEEVRGAERRQNQPPRQSAPPAVVAARAAWPKQNAPDHVPAEFAQDTARLTGKPTVRQRYATLAADAGGLGLTAIPQPTDDAPDDYIVEMGKTLRARMQARAAEEAAK